MQDLDNCINRVDPESAVKACCAGSRSSMNRVDPEPAVKACCAGSS